MSAISPNSVIKFCRFVPLTNDYEHTITFVSRVEQQQYFSDRTKYSVSVQSYQRQNKNTITVEIPEENRPGIASTSDALFDCNYLAFQNTSFSGKWFYAFITQCDYVNNRVARVEYELDVIQTYFFDYNIGECFVEREHTNNDAIGANITPEPFTMNDFVFNDYQPLHERIPSLDLTLMAIAVMYSYRYDESAVSGAMFDGVYSGYRVAVWGIDQAQITALNSWLAGFIQKPDDIHGIYMLPRKFVGQIIEGGGSLPTGTVAPTYNVGLATVVPGSTALDGYVPYNNKLYTYPYNFLSIDNSAGDSLIIRYEFCEDLIPRFELTGTVTQPIQIVLRPVLYKGADKLYTESITLNNYPICSWSYDAYQAWIAQNSIPRKTEAAVKSLGAVSASAAALMATNPVTSAVGLAGAAYSLISLASNLFKSQYDASISADVVKGSISSANVNVAAHEQDFNIGRASLPAEIAEKFDNFLSAYGYATNKVKTPNISGRKRWNYVKTVGFNLTGNLNAEDEMKICRIFDKGITLWHYPYPVGSYIMDDNPIV